MNIGIVIYKITFKVLVNRLRPLLNDLIPSKVTLFWVTIQQAILLMYKRLSITCLSLNTRKEM